MINRGSPRSVEPVQCLAASAEEDSVSLCALRVGGGLFGIDTGKIREVLGNAVMQRVPLAPEFIGGIIPYRGEVLTVVSLRALLGLAPLLSANCVLVLEEDESKERFGLMVDRVDGVIPVNERNFEPNSGPLDARCRALFDGVYKIETGLMVRLDPKLLRPSHLAEKGLFGSHPLIAGRTSRSRNPRADDAVGDLL